MKKYLSLALVLILSLSLLAACTPATNDNGDSGQNGDSEELVEISLGVTANPHGKIAALVVDDLAEEGIKLNLVEFTDYVAPNLSLESGSLDANYFQHGPYLENFNLENDTDLVEIAGIHIEPMALFSSKYESFDDIPDGAEVAIPNDATNGGRALLLLESNGVIKLDPEAGIEATELDIVENPKNLKFTPLEAALIPRTLDSVDAALINGNYALEAGLNPATDSLLIEGADSPYTNILVVRSGEENEEVFQKLTAALQSEKVRQYIEENYDGGVIPAF